MQAGKIRPGLRGMGQMMFAKYLVVVDDECSRTDTNVHNTSEVLFRPCANTDPPSPRYGAASPQRAGPTKAEQHLHQRPV